MGPAVPVGLFLLICLNLALAPAVWAAAGGDIERRAAWAIGLLEILTLGLCVYFPQGAGEREIPTCSNGFNLKQAGSGRRICRRVRIWCALLALAQDLHISVGAAYAQAQRVAAAWGLPSFRMRALIPKHTEGRFLWVFGDPGVKVLRLNLALDALQ